MKRWYLAGLALLSHQAYAANASACGPTPFLLSPLLPLPDAEGVPLDAALVSSSNMTAVTFQLREVTEPTDPGSPPESLPDASAGFDGGAPMGEVPLDTNCHSARDSGAVCVGKPIEPLKPLTTYEWSVAMVEPPGLIPDYLQPSAWQRFTTGDELSSVALPEVEARVTLHEIVTDAMCVSGARVTLEFSSNDPATPVVVNVAGVTPEYVTEAVVLSEETPLVEMTLHTAPDCFTLEAFDQTGARTELRELCPEAELPATTLPTNQPLPGAPPTDEPQPESQPNEPDNATPADDDGEDGVGKAPIEEASDQSGCGVSSARNNRGGGCLLLVMASLVLARGLRRADGGQVG